MPPAPVARVELSPAALLLPAVGATDSLEVRAFDAAGNRLQVTGARFTSSAAPVEVDAAGGVKALGPGAAEVLVELDGHRARSTVLVAVPVAGAVLVRDEQVRSDLRPVNPAETLGVGFQYTVTLSGVTAAAGALIVGTGALPLGGRVVAVSGDDFTLEVVPLDELFPDLELSQQLTLADAALELDPAVTEAFDVTHETDGSLSLTLKGGAPIKGKRKAAKGPPSGKFQFSVGPVDCALETSVVQLSIAKLDVNIDPGLTVERTWSRTRKKVEVISNARASVTVKPVLESNLEGKLTCELELGKRHIPLPGPIGLALGFAVPFGIGFELEGKQPLLAGVSVELKREVRAAARGGFTCDGASCDKIADFQNTSPPVSGPAVTVGKIELPTELKVEGAASAYAFAKLEFGGSQVVRSAGNAVGWRRLAAELIVLKAGIKLEGKFADQEAQAADPAFAGEYRLLFEAGLEPGASVGAFIAFVKITVVKLELKLQVELGTSPKGTLRVEPSSFQALDTVTFTVKLQPATLTFPFVGFNVRAVKVYKLKLNPTSLVLVAESPVVEGQTELTLTALATEAGGTASFAAFLETGLLNPLTCELELERTLALTPMFPPNVPAGVATPLAVTASLVDPRTNLGTPAAGVLVQVSPMGATVTPAAASTTDAGVVRFDVTPVAGTMTLNLGLDGTAPAGQRATGGVSATVTAIDFTGTYDGTSRSFDGQDTPPITPSVSTAARVVISAGDGGMLTLTYVANRVNSPPPRDHYRVSFNGSMLTGDNGLTGGQRRSITATISGDSLMGRINIEDTSNMALWSWIELDLMR